MTVSAYFRAKVWRGEDGRLHVVSADPDVVPNDGVHLSVRTGTASHRNLTELLTANDESASDYITPYNGAKLLKDALGIDVRPQMIYNYVKTGKIQTREDGQVKTVDVIRWGVGYASRKAARDGMTEE